MKTDVPNSIVGCPLSFGPRFTKVSWTEKTELACQPKKLGKCFAALQVPLRQPTCYVQINHLQPSMGYNCH